MQTTPASSYLFVPGTRPDRYAKAFASGADAVILDLEDAVAPQDKQSARDSVAQHLAALPLALVRINGIETEWFRDDLQMCRAAGAAGVVLPKAEQAGDIEFIVKQLGGAPLLPMIESAKGMWNAHAMAQCEGVQRLMFGSFDFQLDMGIPDDNEALLYYRSQLVLVSRVAGIQSPVDGVTASLQDPAVLRADARRAKSLGFGAKLCIHPQQVDIVNDIFRPSEQEIQWAKRIVEAAASAHGAAIAVDGKMVDKPVLLRAQAILARAT